MRAQVPPPCKFAAKFAALRKEVANLQVWDRGMQTLCKYAAIPAKRVQREPFRANMYKISAWTASQRYFSFIGSWAVLIYFCLTLYTTQGKSPNTAVFALLHPLLSALSGVFWIGSAQQHSCKFAVSFQCIFAFAAFETMPAKQRFCSFFQNFGVVRPCGRCTEHFVMFPKGILRER